jgi:hypothetical protein
MATYYIKPAGNGGSDSNNGLSPSTAWATVAKALGASGISSGDTVYVAPGVYSNLIDVQMVSATVPTYIIGDPKALQFPGISPGQVICTNYNTALNGAGFSNHVITGTSKNFLNWSNINFKFNPPYGINVATVRNWTFEKCTFSQRAGGGSLITMTSPASTAMSLTVNKCIFHGGNIGLQLTGGGVSDTTSIQNSVFRHCAQGVSQVACQTAIFNCLFFVSLFAVNQSSGSLVFPATITNCITANCSNDLIGGTLGTLIESYNRLLGASARSNVAVGTGSVTEGDIGVDIGESLLQGLPNIAQLTSFLNSPNANFGTLTGAPTTDIYSNPWTGANPDAGSGTYKQLSNPQYVASDSVVNIRQNTTSRTEFINLNSVGYKFNTASLVASYIKLGGTRTSIPLVTQTVTGTWTSGGFVEIDPINMPGLYRFDIPDTVFASSASAIQIINTANSDKATITYKFTQEYKIDLTQAVPEINVPNTIGDALNAARAGTFGGMTIGNNELSYYSPTNAIIKTFTVDSNTYIRSKKEKNFIPYDGLKLYLDAGKGLSYSGTGSNWVDISGNYNNGFLTNGPTYNSASEGTIVFDGTNDYISFNSQPLSPTAFTIIVNFKISTFTSQGTKFRRLIAINQTGYAFDNPFAFFVNDTGKLGYLFGNGASNTEEMLTITDGPTLEINKWYHATLTFNGTQKKLYIGGNLVSTITNSTTFTNSLNNKLIIGSRNGTDGCMQGSIGTVHIYNRALSDTEVMSNYAVYSNRYVSGIVQSGLMLYIDPNNLNSYPGSGSILYNLVNTQYNGVMNNGASFGTDSSGGYIATDGINDYVKFPLTRSTVPYTVFVFARILSSGRLLSDDTNWLMGNWQGNQNAYHANNWVWSSGGPTGNGWRSHCVTGDYVNDNWKVFANGVKLTENNGGNNGFTNIAWGIWNTNNEACAGNFGVFLVYDRVLTDAEVLQNHEAFRGRYGI